MRIHRNSWRRVLAAAAALLLGTFGLATFQKTADAAVACSATYAKSWDNGGGGFGATLSVTNTGDPLTSWTLSFDFPNNQVITQMWDGTPSPATPTPAGAVITVNPASYNASKGTGATWTVGFNGTYTGTNSNPPSVSCTGTGSGGPQQGLVVSTPSVSVPEGGNAGYTVRLAAQPSGNVTVTNTAGTGDTNITVTGGATLTFTNANWNVAQPVTLSAAEDADSTNGTRPITVASSGLTSVIVNATESDNDIPCDQALIVTPVSVSVPEGSTATYTVRLACRPSSNVTATSTAGSGDTNITVTGGASLTFTTTNWNVPQTVTLSAAEDTDTANGSRTITVASTGSVSVPVTATEADNDGATGAAPALHVSGNRLLTASNATYRMLGVNRASAEFACVQGKGLWDSPQPDQATVNAMKAWNIRTVRIPLNEECWIGTNGTPNGATYQQGVKDYVALLISNGITPIVEMHWNWGQYTGQGAGCSDTAATCQKPMPDAQFAPQFWTSVANAFKGNNAVVFDLFNEPFPDAAANFNATLGWTCWRDGGTCTGISYQVAGMQTLVNTVRATGATNVIMLGGLTWSNDLSQWLTYKPTDPTGNLMAAWHTYNFNACSNVSCWNSQVGAVAAVVPVAAGEIGQNSCAHDYIDQVMAWADSHGVGYMAWTWNPWGVCSSQGNVLITSYDGTPTATFGEGFRAHLLTQNPLS